MLKASSATVAVLLLLTDVLCLARADSHWSYDDPQHWPGVCSSGEYQSPIDIDSSDIQESSFEALSLINYGESYNGTITNNGHSIQINLKHPNKIILTGGGLNRIYVLEQIHFHWDSEHTLSGKRYAFETHYVHYDQKYKTLENALKVKGGLAVVAVLYHESASPSSEIPSLNQMQGLNNGNSRPATFSPESFLPNDLQQYYRYYGSLTTPLCNESVVWTVFANTRPLFRDQIARFRELKYTDGKPLPNNYRPVQKINDRIVYYQTSPPVQVPWTNSANKFTCSFSFTLIFLTIHTILS